MELKPNYIESCTCGCTTITTQQTWRIISWNCSKCKKLLASTTISDSPVAKYYAQKSLFIQTNTNLRKEKGLPPKRTIIKFFDNNGKPILWRDIVAQNKAWEKKLGKCIQRKPF